MPHPASPNKKLFFVADVPHLLKSFRNAFRTHKIIIPEEIRIAENLDSCEVTIDHLKMLIDSEKDPITKLCPSLNDSILNPHHFDKMSVKDALKIFNHGVVAGLRYLVNEENYSRDLLTTAWWIESIVKWFDLTNSRNSKNAISHFDINKYEEAIAFLMKMEKLFNDMKIGKAFKVNQKYARLTTMSVIEMHEEILNFSENHFFLTSRIMNDCIENLFSCIRHRDPLPTARSFRTNLRLIAICQYTKEIKNSSYQFDEDEVSYSDFLSPKIKEVQTSFEEDNPGDDLFDLIPNLDLSNELSQRNKNILYYISGYLLVNVKRNYTTCDQCINALITDDPEYHNPELVKLIQIKDYTGHSLTHMAHNFFINVIIPSEKCIRSLNEQFLLKTKKPLDTLFKELINKNVSIPEGIPNCHNIVDKILNVFIKMRLYNIGNHLTSIKRKEIKEKNKGNHTMSSKTVYQKNISTNKL